MKKLSNLILVPLQNERNSSILIKSYRPLVSASELERVTLQGTEKNIILNIYKVTHFLNK